MIRSINVSSWMLCGGTASVIVHGDNIMPLIRYKSDDTSEELRVRTNNDVKVKFREYAAPFSRYHDALKYLLEHSEPPKVIERKFL